MVNLITKVTNKFGETEGHCKAHIEPPSITISKQSFGGTKLENGFEISKHLVN